MSTNTRESDRSGLFIPFGAGLYWASTALLTFPWGTTREEASDEAFLFTFVQLASMCAGILFILLCSHRFRSRSFQAALVSAGIGFSLLSLAVQLIDPFGENPSANALIVFQAVTLSLHFACFICFWGFNFVSLRKEKAESAVLGTVVVAMAIFCLGSFVEVGDAGPLVALALKIVGVIPFLAMRYSIPLGAAGDSPPERLLISSVRNIFRKEVGISFVGSRFLLGFLNGTLTFLVSCLPFSFPHDIKIPYMFSSIIGLVVLMVVVITTKKPTAILRVAPLIVYGFFSLPEMFANGEGGFLGPPSALVITWFSWLLLTSAQLSDLKKRVSVDGATLSSLEKSLFTFSNIFGFLFVASIWQMLGSDFVTLVVSMFCHAAAFTSVLLSCYLLSDFIGAKERHATIAYVKKMAERQYSMLIRTFAQKKGLTKREAEVYSLLARGYTFSGICIKLQIADSTVRSHIKHIYQKLDLHSRSELNAQLEDFLESEDENASIGH